MDQFCYKLLKIHNKTIYIESDILFSLENFVNKIACGIISHSFVLVFEGNLKNFQKHKIVHDY